MYAASLTLAGKALYADFALDFAFVWILGILFQYLTIVEPGRRAAEPGGRGVAGPTTSIPCPGMFAIPTSTQKGTMTSTNSLPPLP